MTATKTDPKIESIQNLYAAYGRGDVDAMVVDLADDVDWAAEAAGDGAPWHGPFHGKAAVPAFFAAITDNVDVTQFDVLGMASNDTDVVSTVQWSFTVKSTGRSAKMYMQHWWRFADGKIVFFRGSEDSAQTVRAFA